MRNKFIKAKRCYICGKLFDVNLGGWLIAKRYAYFVDGETKDVAICELCGEIMANYIKAKHDEVKHE